jgi:wobble nucleotide-excising tRNase
LFVVSSLIKGLCDEIRSGDGYIKQVFVLTHNVYFHKEVTFVGRRARNAVMKGETFWVVRRMGVRSRLEKHSANPISTAYELLWAELKRSERSNLTVQNTLRRILESYFKVYGGIEFDTIAAMFEGEEKLICNALISWIHDGSHYAHDDLYVVIDDAMVDTYEKVFEAIFKKSGHGAHYEMMMSNARSDEPITLLIA